MGGGPAGKKKTAPHHTGRGQFQTEQFDVPFRSGFKTFAATTARLGVGIGDLETAARQGVGVINGRPAQMVCADRIHHHRDSAAFDGEILIPPLVENHPVLKPGAAALLDVNSQRLPGVLRLLGLEGADVFRGGGGEVEDLLNSGFGLRRHLTATLPAGLHRVNAAQLSERAGRRSATGAGARRDKVRGVCLDGIPVA